MERFTGLLGIVLILGVSFLMSNNRKAINYRTVGVGLLMQVLLAVFILKTETGQNLFQWLGDSINTLLGQADKGAQFVFGSLVNRDLMIKAFGPGNDYIFFFKVVPTIIFVSVLVNMFYHLGILQRVVSFIGKGVHWLMGVSGAEALSNVASTFVGQVEAQIMIKPYLKNMTNSELMASMTGSFACIAGGVMAVYISLGVPAAYLLAASLMAAPGALVISKIMFPETEKSETEGEVKLELSKTHANLVDAIAAGASEGLKVGMNVIAMLIGFIALIALVDLGLGHIGAWINYPELSMNTILGKVFSVFAFAMGVPAQDIEVAGALMGKKMVVNEFVAYLDMVHLKATLDPKTIAITSFALCGFANFSSVAIQIGGIGELAPSRRSDLAKLGFKALIAGTLASYLSATLAGLLL
ncbi:NupC/NupG family nucleoside CNT transporter [Aquirufa antheringensis]|jgi:CNT family concentrative nucleoside transporter|uniref:NupC/NupG family nucleoside CNT transporter n=1 Tax=Aquirufa antheringensis TaxID=2516559 RepID=A0A4Q9BBY6_9BACT|nr:nucleoside transporter C-terminal domain-containing protein [Aquirufa antheringensis]MCE4216086.1 NupC/NupG family nucleoside CNT transporter [Pseudarcicella sp. GAP-15]MCL9967865.1 NupC/NupG family nucleoside CNT transporter [Aquirufa antheringensis]MCZ2477217.1 NupC/NupG family nucleoside CNT transporter [Aquirufa antheringensis]MCZ2485543.1 NupC/NupG family nucleoside CNT transporter [Aquirufa antheringensis]MCZ2486752.1 NupC/NupG family nucleoside CNT transporter [Aquirufa antheringensi